MKYAILDIESTGGAYNEEGITEIAIYKFDGVEVIDRMVSLVNPERPIQPFVSEMTKITQPMLRSAPKFYEIAKRIIEITSDCIIVAHNASFDYRMLTLEFKRLGYNYSRETLCTVQLSKELLPTAESYSLGKLVRSLGIPISDRHRADGDARATLKLFQLLLTKDQNKKIVKKFILSQNKIDSAYQFFHFIQDLPTSIGIFYIYNKHQQLVYLSRASNIKKKVSQLLTGSSTFDKRIQQDIATISFEETGNLLLASIKERDEMALLQPKIKAKHRRPLFNFGIYENFNLPHQIEISKKSSRRKALLYFKSQKEAQQYVKNILDKNLIVLEEIHDFLSKTNNCYIQLKGRKIDEKSLLLVENGMPIGYCFYDLNYQIIMNDILKQKIIPLRKSEEIRAILLHYLIHHKDYKFFEHGKK